MSFNNCFHCWGFLSTRTKVTALVNNPSLLYKCTMPPGYKRSKALWDEARRPGAPRMAFLRAVGYELQPVRFSSFHTVDWQASMQRHSTRFRYWVTDPLPSAIRSLSTVCYRLSTRGWMTLGGILIYFYAIRWIHE